MAYASSPFAPVPVTSMIGVRCASRTPSVQCSAAASLCFGTVSFGSATCPAGQNLIGRRLYVNGQPQTPVNDTKTTWTPAATGTYQLTYTIFCGESVESGQSPALSYDVVGSSPTPSAGAGAGNK